MTLWILFWLSVAALLVIYVWLAELLVRARRDRDEAIQRAQELEGRVLRWEGDCQAAEVRALAVMLKRYGRGGAGIHVTQVPHKEHFSLKPLDEVMIEVYPARGQVKYVLVDYAEASAAAREISGPITV